MHYVHRQYNILLKSNCYETLCEAANKELVNIDKCSDGLIKRKVQCKKSKERALFSVLKKVAVAIFSI